MTEPALDPGPRPELTWLQVSALGVDTRYQRSLDSERSKQSIERIAAEFQWSKFSVLIVAPTDEDDRWIIIDGQHRWQAARKRGLKTVPCVVVPVRDVRAQAEIFLANNAGRVVVNPYAIYHAKLAAGDERACRTKEFCDAAGITIVRSNRQQALLKPGETLALSTLNSFANGAMARLALRAVTIAVRAYAGTPGGLSKDILTVCYLALYADPRADAKIDAWCRRTDPMKFTAQRHRRAMLDEIAHNLLRAPSIAALPDDVKRAAMGAR